MASNQEKIQEALTRIDTALENINTDADWLAYLTFQSRFYNYSAGNILLIYAQNPQASFVKGYKAWHELSIFLFWSEACLATARKSGSSMRS